jgi:hypothetical protein
MIYLRCVKLLFHALEPWYSIDVLERWHGTYRFVDPNTSNFYKNDKTKFVDPNTSNTRVLSDFVHDPKKVMARVAGIKRFM